MNHAATPIPKPGRRFTPALAACAAAIASHAASGQAFLPDGPEEFQGVDIVERRGESIPLDLPVTDADGRRITLADCFDGERPVVLILAYYTCPMQCQLVMNSSMDAFKGVNWDLGDEYRAVTLSFDPRDTPEDAEEWRRDLHRAYGRTIDNNGWPFFTAEEQASKAIADAVGFGYKFIPRAGEYAHPSAIVVLSPDGTVSNYLYGINYDPEQLQLALQDAADGKIGSLYQRVLFRCFIYDSDSNSYVANAMLIMRIGAILTVLFLGGGVGLLFWRAHREQRRNAVDAAAESSSLPGAEPNHRNAA